MNQTRSNSPSAGKGSLENQTPELRDAPDRVPQSEEAAKDAGIARIEALYRVFGGKGPSVWLLYASIAAISYVISLDGSTTSSFLVFATSAFSKHSLLGTISVVNTIISAVAQPLIAKFADITSRPRAYVLALLFYVLGFIIVASSHGVEAVAVGELFYTIGKTGLDLITDIIVADLSPLKWRGFITALTSAPFIINAFVAGEIVDGILARGGDNQWRWGYGVFIILMPAVMAPALAVLFWAEFKAKRQGRLSIASSAWDRRVAESTEKPSFRSVVKDFCIRIDIIGLALLALGFGLVLLPFTLYKTMHGGWHNGGIIAMFIIGGLLLVVFSVYERWYAPHPIMSTRVVNKTFICAIIIDVTYFISGNMRSLYYSSWVYVVKDWSNRNWVYFTNTLTVGLCVFGLMAGLIQRYTHRYKWLQFSGLCIRIVGMGLTLYATGDKATDAALVWTQILIALGGSFSVVGTRVASQASVKHEDMASVIALLALWTKLGGAIGYAIAAAVWTGKMPGYMQKHLPGTSAATIAKLFGSIKTARTAEPAIRTGVIHAYDDTVHLLYLPALIVSFIPLVAACFMQNFYLGDTHNVVEGTNVAGERVRPPAEVVSPDVPDNELANSQAQAQDTNARK